MPFLSSFESFILTHEILLDLIYFCEEYLFIPLGCEAPRQRSVRPPFDNSDIRLCGLESAPTVCFDLKWSFVNRAFEDCSTDPKMTPPSSVVSMVRVRFSFHTTSSWSIEALFVPISCAPSSYRSLCIFNSCLYILVA